MSTALKEKLDTVERSKLRKLESVVAEGISSFVVVGEALKEIRDAKLYRESHKTFEKYVDQKWGIERRRAYQLIDASEASKKLCNTVSQNARAAEITNARQLCELKDVPAESMEAVVNKAADIAGDDPITASDIKQAREEVLSPSKDAWEDVDDELETQPESQAKADPKAKNELTLKEQIAFLKSTIKQHNAAMMRAVGDLHAIASDKPSNDAIMKLFRSIHEAIEGWK